VPSEFGFSIGFGPRCGPVSFELPAETVKRERLVKIEVLGQEGREIAGERRLGQVRLPVPGVGQPKGGGVEERTIDAGKNAAVEAVSGHGVAQVRQVDADLMGPSRPEEAGDKCRVQGTWAQRVDQR